MNISTNIKPGSYFGKKLYLRIFLWFTGRALQAGSAFVPEIRKELNQVPENFSLVMEVLNEGPVLVLALNDSRKLLYLGSEKPDFEPLVHLKIKSVSSAMSMFTLRESAAMSFARERFIIDGDLSSGLAFMRILTIIETLLLPRFIAVRAIKRYPSWKELNPIQKWIYRIILYLRIMTIG